jgi:lysophospholipase L1-like esterase
VYLLPSAVSAITAKPFWRARARGFDYRDARGENGPVRRVRIQRTAHVFRMRAVVDGRLGAVSVAPPDEGTGGCVRLAIAGGDSYGVGFAGGRIENRGAARFAVSRPTAADACRAPGRPVVWLFGDSITQQYCPVLRQSRPGWNVVCQGVGGERTPDGLARLAGALAGREPAPAIVLIEEGINDTVAASSDYTTAGGTLACHASDPSWLDRVTANLRAMADLARARGAVALVATPIYECPVPSAGTCMALPVGDPAACPASRCFLDGACALRAMVAAGPDPWVDFALPGGDAQFGDFLHPNEIGTATLAAKAAAAVEANLPSPTP